MIERYYLGLYEKSMPNNLSLVEKLQTVKACGFDYLELSIDETEEKLARLDWNDRQISELKKSIEENGVPIHSICLSGHRKYPLGHPDAAVRQKSLLIMEKAIVLAAKLGVRMIQLAGYDVYYEPSTAETQKHFEENLQKCVEIASALGVTLAFETMEQEFLNTVKKGMYWVNKMRSPYLQMYPDVGNITNAVNGSATLAAQDLYEGLGHIVAIHLKEVKPGIYREIPYGEGWVDFDLMIFTAYRMGVRMFLAEFWYAGQSDWKKNIEYNGIFLRRKICCAFGPTKTK